MTEAARDQARIVVRAMPGSSSSGIVGRYGDAWKVRVRSAPERGRANSELIGVLAVTLGVSRDAISVAVGAGQRDKHVVIYGLSQDAVEAQLDQASVLR